MTEKVGIVGIGQTKFGKRPDATVRELSYEAVIPALQDAGNCADEVDAVVIGVAGDEFAGQASSGAVINDYVGMTGKPVFRVEAACATGSAAIRTGWTLIQSKLAKTVLVIGSETMTQVGSSRATELMARAGETRWEYPLGTTFPSYYALMATAHMHQYGTTREQLSMVSVKNHKYGAMNPYAHLQKEVTLEEAMKSVTICAPLNLYDCCPISDGAAAVVMANEEKSKKLNDTPIWLSALGASSDRMMIAERQDLVGLEATRRAAQQAYHMANLTPHDVNLALVHDCFTIAEIMAYEDLGFCEKGKGGKLIQDEQTYIGGQIPVNVDGGLKAKGHPLGATGVAMTTEAVRQLRGDAGQRQVDGAEIVLSHNIGETGQYCFVHIYTR